VIATIIAACISGIASITAASIGYINRLHIRTTQDRVQQIQVNVDGRLDAAFARIDDLKRQVAYEKTQPAEDDYGKT
jgi:hypothetical protein